MLKSIRILRKFLKFDLKTRITFIKAFIYLGIARFIILTIPFNKIKSFLGKYKTESTYDISSDKYNYANKISFIVNKVSNHTPWKSKCLVKAFTAQRLLKEEGISSTLYLGVKKDERNNMIAHAWIRCGNYIVTGAESKEGFVTVAKFTN